MRKLVAIAEAKSFSRAAALLSMTQPGLSRFTRDLEERFRIRLFQRHGRGVQLTAAGDCLLQSITEMLRCYDNACSKIGEMTGVVQGEITVAMLESTSRVIALPLIRRFKAVYPKLTIRILSGYSPIIRELIVSGSADFGIVCNTQPLPGLQTDPLVVENLYVISKAGALDDFRQEVPLSELADMALFLTATGGSIRTILSRAMSEMRLRLNVALELEDNETILDLVAEGQGYTVLPFSGIYRELETGRFSIARIAQPSLQRELVLAVPSNRQLSMAGRQAAMLTRRVVRSSSALARWRPL
ncbi:MAG: LysR substrate-binding domain-containing protein [Dongiaceae bacterium]